MASKDSARPPKASRGPRKTVGKPIPRKVAIAPLVKELRKPSFRVVGNIKLSKQAKLLKAGTDNYLIATDFERNEYNLETFTATLTNNQGASESAVPIPKMKRPHYFPKELADHIEKNYEEGKPSSVKFIWPEKPLRHIALMTDQNNQLEKTLYMKDAKYEILAVEEEEEEEEEEEGQGDLPIGADEELSPAQVEEQVLGGVNVNFGEEQ